MWRWRLGGQREGALGISVDLDGFEFDRIETEGERMLLMGARERRRQWLKGVRCIELLLEICREGRCMTW